MGNNKYEQLFKGSMSTRQLSRLYFQLIDTVEAGSEDDKMMTDAFLKADGIALHREFEEAKEIERKSQTATMSCILCTR